MPPKRAKVMPCASAAGDDRSPDPQLKLLQLQLWKNFHLLTGSRVRKASPSMSTLSQLTVSVNHSGTPLPPRSDVQAMSSLSEEFIAKGGPSALSKYLLAQEAAEDSDVEMDGILTPSTTSSTKRSNPTPGAAVSLKSLPLHSIAALNILLGIPSYAQIILRDRRTAMMLVRVAQSVSDDDGDGTLDWTDAALLATLPFEFFQRLLDAHPLDSPEGAEIRQQAVDKGALQLLLACIAIFTQQVNGATVTMKPYGLQFVVGSVSAPSADGAAAKQTKPATTKQKGWAKGTGYGSGATSGSQRWDADGAKQRQRDLEELAVCLLRTLASFINPSTPPSSLSNPILLPAELEEIFKSSHLATAICSYLRNDSMMDVIEHVPMFRAIFHLLRSFAACPKVSSILVPPPGDGSSTSSGSQSIYWLLRKLRNFIPRHVSTTATGAKVDDPEGELAELSEDLILTFTVVKTVVISDHHPRSAIQTPESTVTSDKLYRDTMMTGRNPFAIRSLTAGKMSGGESNGDANHATTSSSIIAPSRLGAPAAANSASPPPIYKEASDCNGSSKPLLRPPLIGAPSSSILKPATLGSSPARSSNPFSRPVEVDYDLADADDVSVAEGDSAAAPPVIPSLKLLSLASFSPAPTSAAVSSGNDFVLRQKLRERVASPNCAAAERKANETPVTANPFDVTPKEKSETESASSNGLPAPSRTLSDSAKILEEARAAKRRKYEEVTVVTGEEDEQNALEVDGTLFIFDKAKGNWVERGFGTLRLNDNNLENQTLQSRLVMRTKRCHRVILNTKVWAEMIIEKTGTKSIRLTATDDDQVRVFLLQASLKEREILLNALEGRLKTLRAQQARATPAAAAAAAAELDQACANIPAEEDEEKRGESISPKKKIE